jgi:hypothetical protein
MMTRSVAIAVSSRRIRRFMMMPMLRNRRLTILFSIRSDIAARVGGEISSAAKRTEIKDFSFILSGCRRRTGFDVHAANWVSFF